MEANHARPAPFPAVLFEDIPARAAEVVDRKVDRQEFYAILSHFAEQAMNGDVTGPPVPVLGSVPLEDLLKRLPVKNEATGEVVGERAVYELRTQTMRIPEVTIVGRATRQQAWTLLDYQYREALKLIEHEQPMGRWALVGVHVDPLDIKRQVETTWSGRAVVDRSAAAQVAMSQTPTDRPSTVRASPGTPETVQVELINVAITFVWAAMSRERMVDPHVSAGGSVETSTAASYVKSGLLDQLPPPWRRQRAQAESILKGILERGAAGLLGLPTVPRDGGAPTMRETTPSGLSYEVLAQRVRDGVPIESVAAILGEPVEAVLRKLGFDEPPSLSAAKARARKGGGE